MIICATSTNEIRRDLLDSCICRLARGDGTALEALYHSTSTAVYSYALSVLKNAHDAEDVLHDCYVTLYRCASGYRSSGKPMAWLITIARNLCLQKLRERKRTADIPNEDWLPYLEAKKEVSSDDRLTIAACMEVLTDEERQIVTLHAVSGLRHREISELTGIPLSTVLSKYSRALKKLKQKLTEGEAQNHA